MVVEGVLLIGCGVMVIYLLAVEEYSARWTERRRMEVGREDGAGGRWGYFSTLTLNQLAIQRGIELGEQPSLPLLDRVRWGLKRMHPADVTPLPLLRRGVLGSVTYAPTW